MFAVHLLGIKRASQGKKKKQGKKGASIAKQNTLRVKIIKRLKYRAVIHPGSRKFRFSCMLLERNKVDFDGFCHFTQIIIKCI